jgi:hypothetical protein
LHRGLGKLRGCCRSLRIDDRQPPSHFGRKAA